MGVNSAPEKGLQPRKIPDSVVRVTRHMARGIERAHPAVFPVALATEMMLAYSDAGDVVYEPFSGSGTQIISAAQNGRHCWAMEIAPSYTDVAVRRFQKFAGEDAILETGETFAQVAQQRGAG